MQIQNITNTFTGPNLTGRTFGMITVLSYAGKSRWNCQCACGELVIKTTTNINRGVKRGDPVTCGHARKARYSTEAPEYAAWEHMNQRCFSPSCKAYKHYGGRGIRVCNRWRTSFEAFLVDMGERPSPKHSIDRIDNNGDYEPSNCRWATTAEQSRNRRDSNLIAFNGETLCLTDWAVRYGINRETLRARLVRGWSIEQAFHTPPNKTFASRVRE